MDRGCTTATLLVAGALLGAASGCVGDIGDRKTGGSDSAQLPKDVGTQASPADTIAPPVIEPQLLPYWVRMQRLAAVAGVSVDDPMFELMRLNHIELGDYDYANGIQPNRMWSPARMSLWVKSLKPVCASGAIHSRYPSLPDDLETMIPAAYGRPMQPEDFDAMTAGAAGVSADMRYTLVCLAVLSSMEFVIQ